LVWGLALWVWWCPAGAARAGATARAAVARMKVDVWTILKIVKRYIREVFERRWEIEVEEQSVQRLRAWERLVGLEAVGLRGREFE
jgi:hypothetical protein